MKNGCQMSNDQLYVWRQNVEANCETWGGSMDYWIQKKDCLEILESMPQNNQNKKTSLKDV